MSPVSIVRGDYIRHENIFFTLTRLEAQLYMPLANYFGQVSIMITVALTVERYLFTTYPLHTQSFCKAKYARRVIAVLLLFCAVLNIPRFLSDTVKKQIAPQSNFTHSVCRTHPFIIEYSSTNSSHIGQCFCMVRKTRDGFAPYRNYYYYTMLALNQILPFAILLCLNLSLIRRVQTANRYTLKELTARQHNINSTTPTINIAKQKRLRDEHRLTKTLVAVVIVFLICNTFTIVSYPDFVQFITSTRYPDYLSVGFRIQILITNIMLLLNYSINFFFYCAFNQKFLDTLKQTFRYEKLFCGFISRGHRSLSATSSMTAQTKSPKTNVHGYSPQSNQRREQSFRKKSSNDSKAPVDL